MRDANGVEKYKIEGNYFESLSIENLETNEKWVAWSNPPKPENHELMYFFSKFALQLNYMTEDLKKRLPPTDTRLRTDVRRWEEGNLREASDQKHRLEVNQRQRKAELKKKLGAKIDADNDSSYYSPKYFREATHGLTGNKFYEYLERNKYGSNYWNDRDKGTWSHMPRIYEDDCEPFFE